MSELRILFLGDIVGRPGMRALFGGLSSLVEEHRAHLVAVNGENARDGFGIEREDAESLFKAGVAVITTGNHVWQRQESYAYLNEEPRILRPANYPNGAPGHGSTLVSCRGVDVAFLNLQGRDRMGMAVDCPFRRGRKIVEELRRKTSCVIVDFHAESGREKEALSYHLDGRVSAVVGTHTHVSTADERILPNGTAAVTDLGMCGPAGSVIGTEPELSIRRSLTQLPLKMELSDSAASLSGVLIGIDSESGKALNIRRVSRAASGI